MLVIRGNVSNVEEKLKEDGEKYFLLSMYDKDYNGFFVVVNENKGYEGKTIQATCFNSDNDFYNVYDNKIGILKEQIDGVVSDVNNIIDGVNCIDFIENAKTKIKSIVLMTSKNKIIKVKLNNSEKVKIANLKQSFLSKKVNINYTNSFYSKDTKKNYLNSEVKNIKIAQTKPKEEK